MDFFSKSFGKLTYNRKLEKLHESYKQCIANQVESYMTNGQMQSTSEICLDEKTKYYHELHNIKKDEHDTIMLFAKERIGESYDYK